MREDETVIAVPDPGDQPPRMDIDAWSKCLSVLDDRVAVAMDCPPVKRGSILMPDTVGGRLRADAGTVISGPIAGERVLVRPYKGLWVAPFCTHHVELDKDKWPVGKYTMAAGIHAVVKMEWTNDEGFIVTPDEARPSRCVGVVAYGKRRGQTIVYSQHHSEDRLVMKDRIEPGLFAIAEEEIYAEMGKSCQARHDCWWPEVRFYGCHGRSWEEDITCILGTNGSIEPLSGWVMLETVRAEQSIMTKDEPFHGEMRECRVLSGTHDGSRVLAKMVPEDTFQLRFVGDMASERTVILPEENVLAVIE